MPLGWLADYGYSATDSISSLSDITVTDANRPFAIPIVPNYEPITYKKISDNEAATVLETFLGEYFSATYAVPNPTFMPDALSRVSAIMPSLVKGCPNLFQAFVGDEYGERHKPIIHIKSLKKVVLMSESVGVAVYNVSGDSLTLLLETDTIQPQVQYNVPKLPNTFLVEGYKFPIFTFYSPVLTRAPSDIPFRTEEIKTLYCDGQSDGILAYAYVISDSGINSYVRDTINALFQDFVDPDYDFGTPNPYQPGGTTEPGGGSGDFDGKSDPVEIPDLPALSSVDTGFISLFNPSIAELRSLASYMWGDLFDVSTWKKIFADPMDAILGLSIVPVAVPNGGGSTIRVGNISTDIVMNKAASQFVSVDCGTINVNEYWGAYLDYEPFTKAELYLPYIGAHPIAVDDIMGKAVHVVYHVDILSGACCAYVKCGNSVLYSFVGQCSCSIPITGNDWTNVINGALSIAASIGTMVATGGASAPMAITDIASTAVNSMKPSIEKSGSISGMGGIMGMQRPYLILTRPRQAIPENQNRYSGYPSFITRKLLDVKGYTEVDSIHLENVPATEQELTEIESLLKGGVIF